MEIKLKTLTPLWTGDLNSECSTINETGIIGSLRWWYEALNKLFLAKDLIEKCLVYARYHANAL